jgi:hypothetical protein
MAKADSVFQPQIEDMQTVTLLDRTISTERAARAPNESEPALNVITLYQDSLTRYWASELWDRVGQLIHCGNVCHKSWKTSDLLRTDVFADAVQAAAEADVLMIAIRDEGELAHFLCDWIVAWIPRRAGREGALVALIGVPEQQDPQSARAYQYLQDVARRAGVDFLPRERKLPNERLAMSTSLEVSPAAIPTVSWSGGASSREAGAIAG